MSGGLPKGWVETTFPRVALLNPKSSLDDDAEVAFVPMPHVPTNFSDKMHFGKRLWRDVKKGFTHFKNGDLIFAKITPCFENGKAAIVPDLPNAHGAGSTEFYVLRPIIVPSAFLFYWVKTSAFLKTAEAQMTGTVGQKRVPKMFVESHPLPLPPLNEQKRIVAKLDAIMPRIDSVNERLEKIPTILKRFRQSVLTAAVTGKLTEKWREEHPEVAEWEDVKLKDICNSISDGDHQAPPKGVEGIPFLVISNITNNKLDFESVTRFVSRAYFDKLKPIRIPKINDILYTVTGSIGNSVIVRDNIDFCFQRHISIIKPNIKLVDVEYLNHYLNTDFAMEQGRACATGTAQLTIPLSGLREYEIPLPPLDEQKEIVRQVDKLFALADKVEEHYQKARARVDALAQSVLAKAFRGELVPQNPDDEPAEILLQRIQEEKKKMEAELKTASRSARETRKNGAKTQPARPEEKQANEP